MLTIERVRTAAALLEGVARRTPLLASPALSAELGTQVLCKAENLQITGAFKFRGAYHHLHLLDRAQRDRGVVGASSGNHAQALARAAGLLGTPCTVVIPEDAPAVKRDAVAKYGGTVVTYQRGVDDRDALVAALAEAKDLAVVPSSNSTDVIAGAGTVALEILQDAPDVEFLLVPVGGGGLAAGCSLVAKSVHASTRVIGVEPVLGDDTRRSLLHRHRVTVPAPATIADGLRHASPEPLPFEINKRFLDAVVTVTDTEIVEAMRLCFQHLKVVVEPSGAVALAALLTGKVRTGSARTAVVLSGGNIGWNTFREMLDSSVASAPTEVNAG